MPEFVDVTHCVLFLLTPLREGRPRSSAAAISRTLFLLTPLREGRPARGEFLLRHAISTHAPAGGATSCSTGATKSGKFLLTPLREGRHSGAKRHDGGIRISTHAPAGGATHEKRLTIVASMIFLLTPLREGRRGTGEDAPSRISHFYSRPCGRGDPDGRHHSPRQH